MSNRTLNLTEDLYTYLLSVTSREPEILKKLREETSHLPMSQMQIGPDQGQFMRLLVQLIGAKKTLEVGVFTGYSSLSVALALPPDGSIIACDVSEEWTSVAQRYWKEAGVENKIHLILAPAKQTLGHLIADGRSETFDFAFIDADKENYDTYYEYSLKLLRQGGLIAIDNVLWSGRVADPNINDKDTVAIRELNQKLHHDERITLSMLSIGDGLTLAMKR
ncbi:MAG TPA: class I SAM-dependent methyltransferase [Blastocatellia bacterium]|nr:class I SAM-dependent methyltransferase [Blastocatellia bacterium]